MVQRKRLDIADQTNLVAILMDNNHRLKSEAIEESVSYFVDSIEFTPSNSPTSFVPPPQQQEPLRLNYDVRARGTPMETNRAAAHATLERTVERLRYAILGTGDAEENVGIGAGVGAGRGRRRVW